MKKRLIILWLSVLCASVLSSLGVLWQDRTSVVDEIDNTYQGIYVVWTILGVLILSIGAAGMFLNLSKRVRSNKWLRVLSFFFMPILFTVLEFHGRSDTDEFLVLLPAIIPFFVCLTIAYIWFLRWLRRDAKQ
jgi:uncharacterized membrane protein HdeD (DUF308 family)